MELKNLTEEGNQKMIEEPYCSSELTRQAPNHLITLLVLNAFVLITTFLENTIILAALRRESSLHPPSKLLYRNLAITDLCVGIIVEPFYVSYWVSAVFKRWNICRYALATSIVAGYTLTGVSLLTLATISVDRLLALLLRIRYRHAATLKRAYIALILIWVVSIVGGTMYFFNRAVTLWYGNIHIFICLLTRIFCYTKIFITLRHNQIQVQEHVSTQRQPRQATPLNMARYRKAVSSALWLQLTLVVCYLPYGVAVASTPQWGVPLSFLLARHYSGTLVYLNSSLNPLLYCWKIREIRQAVKETLRQLGCLPG